MERRKRTQILFHPSVQRPKHSRKRCKLIKESHLFKGKERFNPQAKLEDDCNDEKDPKRISILRRLAKQKKKLDTVLGTNVDFSKIEKKALNCFELKENSFRVSLIVALNKVPVIIVLQMIIIASSIALCFYDFEDVKNESERNKQMIQINNAFNIFFVVEALLKIVAYGAFSMPSSYFKSPWNIFDFCLTVLGVATMTIANKYHQFSRAVLSLRPLRLVSSIKSMKRIATVIWLSTTSLINVAILLVFAIFIFSVSGTGQFFGRTFTKCRLTDKPVNATYWPIDEQQGLCNWNEQDCKNGAYCGSPYDYDIPLRYDRIYEDRNINYGLVNFDTFGQSMLQVFQAITLQGWSGMMYNFRQTYGTTSSMLYFSFLILFCSLIMLNMVLAVITDSFNKRQQTINEQRRERIKKKLQHKIIMISFFLRQKVLWEAKRKYMSLPQVNKNKSKSNYINFTQVVALAFLAEKYGAKKEDKTGFLEFSITGALMMKDSGLQKISDLFTVQRTFKRVKAQKMRFTKKVYEDPKKRLERLKKFLKHRMRTNLDQDLEGSKNRSSERRNSLIIKIKENRTLSIVANKIGLDLDKEINAVTRESSPSRHKISQAQRRQSMSFHRDRSPSFGVPIQGPRDMPSQGNQTSSSEYISEEIKEDSVGFESQAEEQKENQFIDLPRKVPLPQSSSQIHQLSVLPNRTSIHQRRPSFQEHSDSWQEQSEDSEVEEEEEDFESHSFNDDSEENQEENLPEPPALNKHRSSKKAKRLVPRNKTLKRLNTIQAGQRKGKKLSQLKTYNSFKVSRTLREKRLQEIEEEEQKAEKIKRKFRLKLPECPYLERKSQDLKLIVCSDWFDFIIMILIVTNTILMATEQIDMSKQHDKMLEESNYVFVALFALEMLLKLFGLGVKEYCQSKANLFDATLVLLSFVEFAIINQDLGFNGTSFVVLRGFRVFRVLKLAKSWDSLQQLLITVAYAFIDISNLSIIFFIWTFVCTIFGAALFSNEFKFNQEGIYVSENGTSPRANFDSMTSAFTSVFIVVQGEDWQYVMYDAMRTVGWESCFFFIFLVVIGQIILINLVTAVLIDSFNKQKDKQLQKDIEFNKTKSKTLALQGKIKSMEYFKQRLFIFFRDTKKSIILKGKRFFISGFQESVRLGKWKRFNQNEDSEDEEIKNRYTIERLSIFYFTPQNKLRRCLFSIQASSVFEYFILFIVVVSSCLIALDNPLSDSYLKEFLFKLDIALTCVFTFEMIIKIISKGFLFCGKNSYFRQAWNQLDFFICITSLVSYFGSNSLNIIKLFRLLRAIKPLRLISRNDGLKIALKTMMKAAPSLLQLMIILFIFFVLFGIFMVNVMKGSFHQCQISFIDPYLISEVKTKWECLDMGGIWDRRADNFDRFITSIQTFFDITVGHRVRVLWHTADHVGLDMQPQRDYNSKWIVPMTFYILLFGFFFSSLYIGVVVNTFDDVRILYGQYDKLTEHQKKWVTMKKTMINSRAPIRKCESKSKWTKLSFKIKNHYLFRFVKNGLLMYYTALLVSRDPTQGKETQTQNYNQRVYLMMAFFLEFVICIKAFRSHYLRDNWNRFDFAMYLFTLMGYIMGETSRDFLNSIGRVLICATSVRLIRTTKGSKMMRILIDTFMISMPAILNVGSLLLLIIYIYAILGMQLFATVNLQENLNENANFQNFTNSFLTLLRAATGEAWDTIRNDISNPLSLLNQCKTESEVAANDSIEAVMCGDVIWARIFFFTYGLIVQLIFLNLFVAIILQNFQERKESDEQLINYDQVKSFQIAWSNFDARGKNFILVDDMINFMKDLGPPLGLAQEQATNRQYLCQLFEELEIPTYDNKTYVFYHDVMNRLSDYSYKKIELEKFEISLANLLTKEKRMKKLKKQLNKELEVFQKIPTAEENDELRKLNKQFKAKIIRKTLEQDIKIREQVKKKKDSPQESREMWASFIIGQTKDYRQREEQKVDKGSSPFHTPEVNRNNLERKNIQRTPQLFVQNLDKESSDSSYFEAQKSGDLDVAITDTSPRSAIQYFTTNQDFKLKQSIREGENQSEMAESEEPEAQFNLQENLTAKSLGTLVDAQTVREDIYETEDVVPTARALLNRAEQHPTGQVKLRFEDSPRQRRVHALSLIERQNQL